MGELSVLLSGQLDPTLGTPCRVQKIIDELDDPYKTKLADLVSTTFVDGGMPDTQLAKLMQQAGLQCSATMINRHRRGVCTCPTER